MAKQLRVDAAELTDVGRRRSNNQDNLALRIPDDPQELERHGTLFVVADGMGGHAAGEIASTIAVQTISSTYFDTSTADVLQNMGIAIKRANEAILQISREKAENVGMGTTLVAAVVCQGILYVANIGDSRAYIVRKGRLRQITEDHSWVAEQVRAGVLTEEQARTHVHRNVITRSLGTQPNVVADVFVEPAREDDILILCSDGLHGYVRDEIIAETVRTLPTKEAARRLIELANEAGGPDNISVIVVRVEEVPVAPPELLERLQLLNDQPRQTHPMPIVAGTSGPKDKVREPETAITAKTDAASIADIDTAKTSTRQRRTSLRSTLLRIVAVLIVVVIATGVWYVTLGPYAQKQRIANRIDQDVSKSLSDYRQIPESSASIQTKLSILAQDQAMLQQDLTLDLTVDQRSRLTNALNAIVPVAKQLFDSYNATPNGQFIALESTSHKVLSLSCNVPLRNALVAPVLSAPPEPTPTPPPAPGSTPTPTPTPSTPTPTPSPTPPPLSIPAGSKALFSLDRSGNVIPILASESIAKCGNPIAQNVIDLAATDTALVLLVGGTANSPNANVTSISNTTLAQTPLVSLSALPATATPKALAYTPGLIAVLTHASNGDVIYLYTGATPDPAKPLTIPLSGPARSMALGGNGILYVLMENGAIISILPSNQTVHTVGGLKVLSPLQLDNPSSFTSATPIPTPQASVRHGSTDGLNTIATIFEGVLNGPLADAATPDPSPTATPAPTATPSPVPSTTPSTVLGSATFIVSHAGAIPRMAILDPQNRRVILTQASGLDLQLVNQYAYSKALGSAIALALAPDGHQLSVLNPDSLVQIELP